MIFLIDPVEMGRENGCQEKSGAVGSVEEDVAEHIFDKPIPG